MSWFQMCSWLRLQSNIAIMIDIDNWYWTNVSRKNRCDLPDIKWNWWNRWKLGLLASLEKINLINQSKESLLLKKALIRSKPKIWYHAALGIFSTNLCINCQSEAKIRVLTENLYKSVWIAARLWVYGLCVLKHLDRW